MSDNTEKFTYTRDSLLKVLVSAYNQGFLDGTKKRNSLDDLQFLADHEIGHARVKETLLTNKAADYMTNSELEEELKKAHKVTEDWKSTTRFLLDNCVELIDGFEAANKKLKKIERGSLPYGIGRLVPITNSELEELENSAYFLKKEHDNG